MPRPALNPQAGLASPRRVRPVTIAVEGPCFAGKTSLVLALGELLEVLTIPEYAELAPLPPFPPRDLDDVRAALDYLLAVELRRSANARLLGAETGVVLCDRSPLSCIAFQHAVGRLGVPADAGLAAELFTAAAERGEIIQPDAYLYLHLDRTVALARQAVRGPVLACLMDPTVLTAMHAVYQRFLDRLPSDRRLVLDGSGPRPAMIERAAGFVRAQRALGPRPTSPCAWPALLGGSLRDGDTKEPRRP